MDHHYRFRIQRLIAAKGHLFQLRVGMVGERDFEFLPVHRTAFADRVDLEPAHTNVADVHLELSGLLEWIGARQARATA